MVVVRGFSRAKFLGGLLWCLRSRLFLWAFWVVVSCLSAGCCLCIGGLAVGLALFFGHAWAGFGRVWRCWVLHPTRSGSQGLKSTDQEVVFETGKRIGNVKIQQPESRNNCRTLTEQRNRNLTEALPHDLESIASSFPEPIGSAKRMHGCQRWEASDWTTAGKEKPSFVAELSIS